MLASRMKLMFSANSVLAASLVVGLVLLASSPTTVALQTYKTIHKSQKPSCPQWFSCAPDFIIASSNSFAADLTSGSTPIAALSVGHALESSVSEEDPHHFAGHKPLLPLDANDYVMLAVAVVTLFVAAGGGIGGGAVYVPMYILIGGKYLQELPVALSTSLDAHQQLLDLIRKAERVIKTCLCVWCMPLL
jgi:hypothetical protein